MNSVESDVDMAEGKKNLIFIELEEVNFILMTE
jgi:hypothetical protein